jgi:hypothetical protein
MGVNKNIFYEDGDFVCDEGHKYPSMEDVQQQLSILEAAGVKIQEDPPAKKEEAPVPPKLHVVPEDREEEDEREAEALKSMTMVPPPLAEVSDIAALAEKIAIREQEGVMVAGPMVFHKKPEVRELPGGDLEILVIIKDPNSSYLKGEAAFKGKTVEEYLQEMIDFGMDSRWFF